MDMTAEDRLPLSLLELLSNTLVLDATLPYLPLSSIFRLSAVSKAFKRLVFETPKVFRYLDLSQCRGAYVAPSGMPLDSGGHNWRAERMDENLTEDEFYAGPLRGVCSKLSKMGIIRDVQTLILDGLGSVTHDVLSDILLSEQYNVRLLSVLGCPNLNERKFQALLHYLCRPSRPEGTPKLKGVYVFGTSENVAKQSQSPQSQSLTPQARRGNGITTVPGAQIGASSSSTSPTSSSSSSATPTTNANPWFHPTGHILFPFSNFQFWEETLRVCSGIIAFDAVLCTHMHTEMAPYRSNSMNAYLTSSSMSTPLATYALGSNGCAGCGCAPDGAPVWGIDETTSFPLVSPPPFSGRLVDAVRPPPPTDTGERQRLVVSCTWCLSDRHCQSCHRYWCSRCYDPQRRKRALQLEAKAEHDHGNGIQSNDVNGGSLSEELRKASVGGGTPVIKVYNGLCTQFCALDADLMAGNGGMWG